MKFGNEEESKYKEDQLKKKEENLKRQELQMGVVLHDLNNLISRVRLLCALRCKNETKYDPKSIDCSLEYNFFYIRNILRAYQMIINSYHLNESCLVYSKCVYSIVNRICSIYTPMNKVHIQINGESTKEYKLNDSCDLAITMIVDNAISNSPDNFNFDISFSEVNNCLTVVFSSWERYYENNDTHDSMKRGFGSNVIWNPKDQEVALNLFKQICYSNSIEYSFEKGGEKKEVDGKHYQSSIVKLVFISEYK